MGLLDRLVKSIGNATGKGGSAAQQDWLADLTGSPAALMQQVFDALDTLAEQNALDVAHLYQADARLTPVCAEIEAEIVRQRRLGTGQRLLRQYGERFGRAYAMLARQAATGENERTLCRLRAVHLLGRTSRLARVFHEDLAAVRQECLALFAEAHRAGQALTRRHIYADRNTTTAATAAAAESSPAQELAITLLWETVPFDTLTPEQAEYLERLMNVYGAQIVLRTAAGATVPFAVLADGQVLPPTRVGAAQPVLFVGPGQLAGHLATARKLADDADLPLWAGAWLPGTDLFSVKTMAQRVALAWECKTVPRGQERCQRTDSLRVAGGFDNARRAIAYAAYVRAGGHLDIYQGWMPAISERIREVMVGVDREQRDLAPTEILLALEGMGDTQAVEAWATCDSSAYGYNLATPGYRTWLTVGALIAVRESQHIDWRLGIVRRLYGTGKARHAGVEILPGLPLPAGIGHEGRLAQVTLSELRDAILMVDTDSDDALWLVVPFECVVEGVYLLMGQGRRLVRIGALQHAGGTVRIYACRYADNASVPQP